MVKADAILLEMSNPQTEQAAVDAQLQLKAAEAEYQSLRVKLDSDLMNQKAGAATAIKRPGAADSSWMLYGGIAAVALVGYLALRKR